MLNPLLALIIIVSVSDEFSFLTYRQSILSGLTKTQFVLSKLLVSIALSFYASILVLVLGFTVGLINTQNPSVTKIIAELQLIPLYSLQTLAYLAFAMFLAVLLRKSALTITIFFVYTLVIEILLRFFIQHPVRDYFPARIISRLVPMPDHLQQVADSVPPSNVVVAVGYILVFWGLSQIVLIRREV